MTLPRGVDILTALPSGYVPSGSLLVVCNREVGPASFVLQWCAPAFHGQFDRCAHNPIEVCQLCHSPSINRLTGPFGSGSGDEAVRVSSSVRLGRCAGDGSSALAVWPGGGQSGYAARVCFGRCQRQFGDCVVTNCCVLAGSGSTLEAPLSN